MSEVPVCDNALRQERLEELYRLDERCEEDHPFHGVYTGLFQGQSDMGRALEIVHFVEDNFVKYRSESLDSESPDSIIMDEEMITVLRQAAHGAQNIDPLLRCLATVKKRGWMEYEEARFLRCYYNKIISVFYTVDS